MTEATPTDRVDYHVTMLAADRRVAILAEGERKGMWKFLAQEGGSYLVEQEGHTMFLTPAEVDRIPFIHFVNHDVDLSLLRT